jgi:hypothetical protein
MPLLAQEIGEHFRFLDRGGADQNRLASFAGLLDVHRRSPGIFLDRAVDLVVLVDTLRSAHWSGFRPRPAVDVAEFLCFGRGRAGHAGQLVVHAEIVLEGDRGQGLVFRLDLAHAFLGLERLVLTFGEAPARHHAAGELVDDDNLVIADDVVLVALEQLVCLQRVVDVVDHGNVLDVVERFTLQHVGFGEHPSSFSVPASVKSPSAASRRSRSLRARQLRNQRVDAVVELGAVIERSGDDQRGARLVDQDGVDLVDDGVVVAALHHLGAVVLHVVAQVVEAEFVVGA